MTEEEKKAIEYLNNIGKLADDCDKYATHIEIKKMKICADYISKLQKENKELNETLKCTQNSWFEDTKEIEKQNKVIDFVTKEINSLFVEENGEIIFLKSAEEIKKHYFKKVEEENEEKNENI